MPSINLPTEQELKKQIMLTSLVIWKDALTDQEIERWLSNFCGEVFDANYERQLALWLLANFVYYNDQEVKHLCRTLFRDFIHEMIKSSKDTVADKELAVKSILARVKFAPLGKPSESGPFLLYPFRQENSLTTENFVADNVASIPSSVDTIVFVDDVALSDGKEDSQAYLHAKPLIDSKYAGKKIVFVTLISSDRAKQFLESEGYKVISCITLDDGNKCFSTSSNVFHHFPEHRDNCKKFANHYGTKVKNDHPLGFKDGQYLFGFFYNTPDNSLPIFWSTSNGWKPIVKRYDKHMKGQYEIGKYI